METVRRPDPKPLSVIYRLEPLIALLDSGIRGICKKSYRGNRKGRNGRLGIYDFDNWRKINQETLKCVGVEQMDKVTAYTLVAPAVPTAACFKRSWYKGQPPTWIACVTGETDIAGPRLLRVAQNDMAERPNRAMLDFEGNGCRHTEFGVYDYDGTSERHTLDFRLDESNQRTSSLTTETHRPIQVHYWVHRKIESSSGSKPYDDVFSLYLYLRETNPHTVDSRDEGEQAHVLT